MFGLKCFTHGVTFAMSSHLVWLQNQHVFMIIFTMLIIYILVFCPLQHSLIAMSFCWIFWTKWMWSDPNLSMLSISNSISPNHMHSIETVECPLCILVSRRHRDKHQVLFKWFIFIVDIRRSRNYHPTNLAGVGTWDNSKYLACLPCTPQMWTARGTSIIALCLSPTYKYLSPALKKSFFHLSTSVKTLAPPLARDDAGDEALSCRDFSDAVLTPVADIILSAVAVGVLCRQVRARWAELLGLLFFPSSSSSCGNYNSIFTTFLIFKIHPVYQK